MLGRVEQTRDKSTLEPGEPNVANQLRAEQQPLSHYLFPQYLATE